MKKLLISMLAALLCLGMLASCGGGNTSTTATTATTDTTGTTNTNPDNDPVIPENALKLVVAGASDYQIVVSSEDDEVADVAYELRWTIKQLTGVELPIVEDTAPVKDTEIVVGVTARKALYTAPDQNYRAGYAAFIAGDRVVLEGGSLAGVSDAMRVFVKECLGYDLDGEDIYFVTPEDTLVCKNEFSFVMPFYSMFTDALSATIVYDGTYMQMRLAYVLRDQLSAALKISDEDPVPVLQTKNAEHWIEGNIIELAVDRKIDDGKWSIEIVDDDRVVLCAKDYYGFVSGAKKLASYFKTQKQYITEEQATGDYRDTLTELERATAYAYERQGEHRVMFYNGLWDSFNKEERIELNALVVAQYMPDVLGLQEMKSTKRGDNAVGNGGLIAELAKLGYVEAVDPRVKNLYATSEKIPGTDASLTTDTEEHVELNGYGTGGGTKVTVNGETFYTFFNCAPLLYNTRTTRLIEAEYYWYKNQWDKRTGQTHDNSAGDCASKAATWGVFEDIDTGDRYIAISTHMCTRSDYVRGLQAQEMVELIAELTEKYDYPVILGGDYNGTYEGANYKCFEQNGFIDVERNDLASVYTSKTRGHHTYPQNDAEKGCVQPAPEDNTGTMGSDKSVDHIMLTNVDEGEMDVYVFGVVIDECTMSGADHFPMYMDFSIN